MYTGETRVQLQLLCDSDICISTVLLFNYLLINCHRKYVRSFNLRQLVKGTLFLYDPLVFHQRQRQKNHHL